MVVMAGIAIICEVDECVILMHWIENYVVAGLFHSCNRLEEGVWSVRLRIDFFKKGRRNV